MWKGSHELVMIQYWEIFGQQDIFYDLAFDNGKISRAPISSSALALWTAPTSRKHRRQILDT